MKRSLAWPCIVLCVLSNIAKADITREVSRFTELAAAISEANSYTDGTFTISFLDGFNVNDGNQSPQQFISLQSGARLVIEGNGKTLGMEGADRAFYVASGEVEFRNLTIMDGKAAGGNGGSGGGGGMGAGGAIYVGNRGQGTYVTLSGVSLSNNIAQGGNGGQLLWAEGIGNKPMIGGGGGMGGHGGTGAVFQVWPSKETFGGGGGFGMGADGGTGYGYQSEEAKATRGGDGAYAGGASGGSGVIKYSHGEGGANGGGGGAAYNEESGTWARGGGGGGGVGGENGYISTTYEHELPSTDEGIGGDGGYGGGGGGGSHFGGYGGFGGGGGAALRDLGGKGGFGGGGGFGEGAAASGGFGAGNAITTSGESPTRYIGGGGMGAGGAIYVEKGAHLTINGDASSFSNNQVAGGIASENAGNGSAIGSNLFLGGDVIYQVNTLSSVIEISGLGGGGDNSDPNVAAHSYDSNTLGNLIKSGSGKLRLTGVNSYGGTTKVEEGTFAIATSSIFTRRYQISAGATLEVELDNFRPVEILTEEAARILVTGENVDLSQSTLSEGTVIINGSASGLKSTGKSLRIGGEGTLQGFASAATFTTTSKLVLDNTIWVDDTAFEFTLGETLLTSTGSSVFSNVSTGGLTFTIINLTSGIKVGDRIALMTFEDISSFDLSKFVLETKIQHFSGELYGEITGSARTLGVIVHTIPEPGTFGLLALALMGILGRCMCRAS